MNLNFRNPYQLGVDVGSRTVKGVKFKISRSHVYLDKYFFYDLSETGENYPEKSNAAETLRAAIELQKLQKSQVATSLKDNDIMFFTFVLPKLKKKELDIAVAHELSEHTAIPIDELTFDYISESPDGGAAVPSDQEQITVKAYCAKVQTVRQQMTLIQSAALKPTSIESDMLAITAMLDFNGYISPDEICAVFDLGESHLAAGLIADGELKFVRSNNITGGSINEKLKKALNISYEQAEVLKLAHDFNPTDAAQSNPANKVIDESFSEVFQEAKSALGFFAEYSEYSAKIDRIFLVGGGSQGKNLDKAFETFFKIPTEVVNPFRNIELYSSAEHSKGDGFEKVVPYMSTAVGLALRGIELKRPHG